VNTLGDGITETTCGAAPGAAKRCVGAIDESHTPKTINMLEAVNMAAKRGKILFFMLI
jgi:hypothetical protein